MGADLLKGLETEENHDRHRASTLLTPSLPRFTTSESLGWNLYF